MPPKQQKPPRPKVNDVTLRISFLEQAAALMVSKSKSQTDTAARLSKLYVEELHEVKNVHQTILGPDFRRLQCKRCRRIWLPNADGDNGIQVGFSKKRVVRRCAECGATTRYVHNREYKSRSEKCGDVS